MDDDTRPLFDAIHAQTHAAVAHDLATAAALPDLLALTQATLQHTTRTLTAVQEQAEVKTACSAGCSFCCWNRIDAPAHEILLIVRYILAHWPEEDIAALRLAARARRDTDRGMDYAARQRTQRPCVLLHDSMCRVYPVRPGACRRYFSGSIDACHRLWQDPEAEATVGIPLLHKTGHAMGTAVLRAFMGAGYDHFFYDLPAALHEALEDPACEQRWMDKNPVFSEEARTLMPPPGLPPPALPPGQ